MSLGSIITVSILAAVALVALVADLRDDPGDGQTLSLMDRSLWRILGFFGIGGVPPMLALAVLTSTAAIAAAALDVIAIMHLGDHYPVWFPANALATGLGVGLACDRMLAATSLEGEQISYM